MKTKMMILILSACTFSMAHAADTKDQMKAKVGADKDQVNTACATDAQNLGCAGKTVGHDLLKCMHAAKREKKDYKFQDSCKTAMQTFHGDKDTLKAEREAEKAEKK